MKIILRFSSFLVFLLIAVILVQNLDFSVDLNFLDKSYTNIRLPLVLLLSGGIGILIGAFIMSLVALQYKAETHNANKKVKGLLRELDSLRNLSIEDISIDDLNIDEIKPVQLPIIEKPESNENPEKE
jgi:uncharacterized integral membrane protein